MCLDAVLYTHASNKAGDNKGNKMKYIDAVAKFGKQEVAAAIAAADKSENLQAVTDGLRVLVVASVGSTVAPCYDRIRREEFRLNPL